jgi:hypothetical protein
LRAAAVDYDLLQAPTTFAVKLPAILLMRPSQNTLDEGDQLAFIGFVLLPVCESDRRTFIEQARSVGLTTTKFNSKITHLQTLNRDH